MSDAARPSAAVMAMIERLVAFDTTSHLSNLALIEDVRGYLAGLGIRSRLTTDDHGHKANLFATLGPADRPGIVLSGHTDVVPVEGQDWHSNPFQVVERADRLYGRGTSDMKSFLALCLALAPEFLERGLTVPIHLAFSYDEEVGCLGVRRLLADLAHLPVQPRLCIVGEPTEMRVIVGHKSKRSMRCHVHGLECHSALAPQGVNAVEAAAEAVAHLKRIARRMRDEGPFHQLFDPPFTTVHTGVIHGGTALNIVPRECWFDFEFRAIPGHDDAALLSETKEWVAAHVEPEMKAVSPEAGFEWHETNHTAGLDMRDDDEATRFVSALTGANATGRVSFATEAGLFQQAGIPTIVCGPGSIEQAHKPDEFITLDQIAQGEAFLRRLMAQVCAAA